MIGARREGLWLGLIAVGGGVLRFWQLGAQSLWLDELFSVFLSRRDVAAIVAGTMADTQPPLYYLLLHAALQLGSDETAARLLSAVFGTATIPLVYWLGKELFKLRSTALLGALLVAISPFQIAYAQEARMYAMLAFWQLAGALFLARAWRKGNLADWLVFALAEALALYSHSLGILGLVAVDVWLIWQWRAARVRAREILASHALILFLFAPWLAAMTGQVNRVLTGFWDAPSTLLNLLRTVFVLIFGNALPTTWVPVGLLVVLLLFTLAMYHSAAALHGKELGADEREGLRLIVCIALIPPVLLFMLSLIRPVYIERVVILSSAGLALLFAWAWTRRPRIPEKVLAAAAALLVLAALGNYYLHPDRIKPPMRDAAAVLGQSWQPGDTVVHTSDWTALAFGYYLPSIPQHFLAGDPAYLNPTTRGNSGRIAGLSPEGESSLTLARGRLWLVVALEHNEEYQQQRVVEFTEQYGQPQSQEIGGIYLLAFEPRTRY